MSNFRPIDRDSGFLMPPSVDEWLPQRHLARFVVEVIAGLDLRAMTGSYRGSGEASYHPGLLLGILIYGYATGVFSSRKLERATLTRWRSASSPPTSIPTTTRSPHSGGAF
jgi:transposase